MQAQNLEELKRLILKVLPDIIREDPAIRAYLKDLLKDSFAEKEKTEDRIEKLYQELVRLREESERKWEEYLKERDRMWAELERQREESERKWQESMAEIRKLREESERRWEESERRWEEYRQERDRMWAELERQREESERKWQESMAEIRRLARKHDSTIGALGARWGLHSEESFRNALKGILEESFPVKVERYLNYDREGIVFGRPDQVELDLIIKNGDIMVAEIKSSVSKADVYVFLKKLEFYKRHEGVHVKRAILISPMVEPEARKFAEESGIEVYSYAEDVEGLGESRDASP